MRQKAGTWSGAAPGPLACAAGAPPGRYSPAAIFSAVVIVTSASLKDFHWSHGVCAAAEAAAESRRAKVRIMITSCIVSLKIFYTRGAADTGLACLAAPHGRTVLRVALI